MRFIPIGPQEADANRTQRAVIKAGLKRNTSTPRRKESRPVTSPRRRKKR